VAAVSVELAARLCVVVAMVCGVAIVLLGNRR